MPKDVETCCGCDGKGWFYDSTYDRTGALEKCYRCHGTGLNAAAVKRIITNAMVPFLMPAPKDQS